MADREKLIELIKEAYSPVMGGFADEEKVRWLAGLDIYYNWEDVADHLIANGIIVSPVKVGQKVWEINFKNNIIEVEIIGMEIEQWVENYGLDNDILLRVGHRLDTGGFTFHYLHSDDIGTKLFFTKEDAEQALAEQMKEVK